MRIESYFREIQELLANNQSFEVTYERRSTHTGFVKGHILFIDGSELHFREFIDVEQGYDRLMYTYHYTSTSGFVFRYDNSGHHRKLNLPTYPHHKHDGSEDNVIACEAPDLATVLTEIIENHIEPLWPEFGR